MSLNTKTHRYRPKASNTRHIEQMMLVKVSAKYKLDVTVNFSIRHVLTLDLLSMYNWVNRNKKNRLPMLVGDMKRHLVETGRWRKKEDSRLLIADLHRNGLIESNHRRLLDRSRVSITPLGSNLLRSYNELTYERLYKEYEALRI